MITDYFETFFSKLGIDVQEQFYLLFQKSSPRDKIFLFIKLKYGDEVTFKELSEKLHFSTIRSVYTGYLDKIRSGIIGS